jgi:hypothetical protein
VEPSEAIAEIYDRIASEPLNPVWISISDRDAAIARARELEDGPAKALDKSDGQTRQQAIPGQRSTLHHPTRLGILVIS